MLRKVKNYTMSSTGRLSFQIKQPQRFHIDDTSGHHFELHFSILSYPEVKYN